MSNIFKVKENKRLVREQYKLNIETPETDQTYADIIYDKPHKDSFIEKIEKVQCNACLVITGAFKSTSRECIYEELGLESFRIVFLIQNCERTFT